MRILKDKIDKKKRIGSIDLIPETSDDIYLLVNLLEKEDIVRSLTTRKIILEGKDSRKVTLLMDVKIEELTPDLPNDTIFLKGRIASTHEFIRIGAYHSIEIELNKRISILKNYWTSYSLNLINEMKKVSLSMLFCIFYEKDCVILTVTKNFSKIVHKMSWKSKNLKNFNDYVLKHVDGIKVVVLCIFREEKPSLLQQITSSKELTKHSKLFCEIKVSNELKNALPSNIVSTTINNNNTLIQKIELETEILQMNTFLKNLNNNPSLTCIGLLEIQEALEYGAINSLLITFEKIKSFNFEERKMVDELIEQIKFNKGIVCVLPESNFNGEKLKEFGGIAANLKYSFK